MTIRELKIQGILIKLMRETLDLQDVTDKIERNKKCAELISKYYKQIADL